MKSITFKLTNGAELTGGAISETENFWEVEVDIAGNKFVYVVSKGKNIGIPCQSFSDLPDKKDDRAIKQRFDEEVEFELKLPSRYRYQPSKPINILDLT